MQKAFIEMIKEAGRIAFFGAATALVGWVGHQLAGLDPTSTYYVVATLVLRLADKWVHEHQGINSSGLAPF